jgi:filamentous hemagglutinin family protein
MCKQTTAGLIVPVLLITGGLFSLHVRQAHAEVITDGTVGAAQNLGGPNFVIPQTLGSIRGTNLFHSFQNFNIANTESATFTGANSLQNVISRVTGGQSSNINGLLRSQVGQAAFYFINPAGVVFGVDAKVDVPGDFHVSTASELRFSDGAVFSSVQPDVSALSMASPAEFGFLGDQSSAIRVEQSNLIFASGTTTSLSGGQIVIDSGVLVNEGGEIRLTTVGLGNTTLPITGEASANDLGSLMIENSGISVDGNGAGRIAITSGTTKITNSALFANNTGANTADAFNGIAINVSSLELDNSIVASNAFSDGSAGNVNISAAEIDILNGTRISSSTIASGDAGRINIDVEDLTIDRVSSTNVTAITSNVEANASGNAGIIKVQARNLTIDGRSNDDGQSSGFITGIVSNANTNSSGNAGTVDIMVTDKLEIVSEGQISSSIFEGAMGNAGAVAVRAGDVIIDRQSGTSGTGIFSNTNPNSIGNAGNIAVQARSLTIDGRSIDFATGIFSIANRDSSGNAGNIDVEVTESLNIVRSGQISSSLSEDTTGDAGAITIQARNLTIDGQSNEDGQSSGLVTGIVSNANMNSSGNAGTVDVMVTDKLEIVSEGQISSSIFENALGNAGTVTVRAGDVIIDRQSGTSGTGIFTNANPNSIGNAGNITVQAHNLSIDGQSIDFATGIFSNARRDSSGNAGNIDIEVAESLNIVGSGQISSNIFEGTLGNAGTVNVDSGSLTIDGQIGDFATGILSEARSGSSGKAGSVVVKSRESANILNGGRISSTTFATGDAGLVNVQAGSLIIDRQGNDFLTGIFSDAAPNSSGNAGSVVVAATETASILNGGQISSNTFATGNADSVNIQADTLTIDPQTSGFLTGIFSNANINSSGNAGSINLEVTDTLNVFRSGLISTSTLSTGEAGNITIHAGQVVMDGRNNNSPVGILSVASPDSLGQAGNIILDVGSLFIANGLISISSLPIVDPDTLVLIKPTEIKISANNITLVNSFVATTSVENVPAGSINIQASNRLFLDPSGILTTANNADGGDITLAGGTAIFQDSQIRTSVRGQGDGGNIALDFKNLVLDTGFIQANTAGFGSQGGDIAINVDALTASGNALLSGGNTPFSFEAGSGNNVIQAAAPDGVNGAIDISSPELNIKGDLAGLTSDLTDVDTLVRDPCSIAGTQQSVLVTGRRGGLPETAQDALAVPLNRNRLQQILSDPDISEEDREPHQSGVLLDGEINRSALAFAAVERGCIN